jgi:hypothetical protein
MSLSDINRARLAAREAPDRYTVHVNVLKTVGGGDSKQTTKLIEFSLTGEDLAALISKGISALYLAEPDQRTETVTNGAGDIIGTVKR